MFGPLVNVYQSTDGVTKAPQLHSSAAMTYVKYKREIIQVTGVS